MCNVCDEAKAAQDRAYAKFEKAGTEFNEALNSYAETRIDYVKSDLARALGYAAHVQARFIFNNNCDDEEAKFQHEEAEAHYAKMEGVYFRIQSERVNRRRYFEKVRADYNEAMTHYSIALNFYKMVISENCQDK